MGWVEEKREGKRERGGEREEKGTRGRKRERERRTKESKHFSLKYMKHKNIKCSCNYIRVVTKFSVVTK